MRVDRYSEIDFFHINFIHYHLFGGKNIFSHSGNYYRNHVSFSSAYWVVHRVCFSNVYLYSTLTTNSASISNYNHDVNLFRFMAYWLPSFIPSSIIFEDCFLVFDDMSSPANLGTKFNRGIGSWSTKISTDWHFPSMFPLCLK